MLGPNIRPGSQVVRHPGPIACRGLRLRRDPRSRRLRHGGRPAAVVMILVDATVVIDFTRGKDSKLLSLFTRLSLSICGIVRAEVLAGARTAVDRATLIGI